MQKNKFLWSKPKLTVLLRTEKGEKVLRACKQGGSWLGAPMRINGGCQWLYAPHSCAKCYDFGAS